MLTILYRFILTPRLCLLVTSKQSIWKASLLVLGLVSVFFIRNHFGVMGLLTCMLFIFCLVFMQVAVIEFSAQLMNYPSRFLPVMQWMLLSLYPITVIPIFLSFSKLSIWVSSQQLLITSVILASIGTLQVIVIRSFYSCSLGRGIMLWALPFLIVWALIFTLGIGLMTRLSGMLQL